MKQPQPQKETLRTRQKAETYALILKTARDLFEEIGFEKTTLRKVAAEVGNTPGALFKHFENKAALLAAILFDDIERVQKEAIKTIPQDVTVQTQFLHVAERYLRYYSERPVLSKILVQHVLFIEGEWAEKFMNQTNQLIYHFAKLIQHAKDKSEIGQNVDPNVLATAFFSHYLFVLIHSVNATVLDLNFGIELLKTLINQAVDGCK